MKINEILKKKITLSFEVFPPKKTGSGEIEKLYKAIDTLKTLTPDFINCGLLSRRAYGKPNCYILHHVVHIIVFETPHSVHINRFAVTLCEQEVKI